jgi:LysR family cys regulon transcriptional activator
MTPQQMRYLCAIADCGFNISRAALTLHTSQPGISKQIKLLEQQLGTTLLTRSAGRVTGLTEGGERVLGAARRILKELDSLKLMGADFLGQESGQFVVATMHTHARAVLPPVLRELRERYPGVVVDVRQGTPSYIVDMVRAGEADVGVTIEEPPPSGGVISLPCMLIPRVLMVPAGHPLLALETVAFEDLLRYPVVSQKSLSAGGWAVGRVLKTKGLTLEPVVLANDSSVIKAFVEEGIGIAIIPAVMYDAERDSKLRTIDVSRLFGASQLTAVIDPYRYQRGYVYDFIARLAPAWDRAAVQREARRYLIENEQPASQPPARSEDPA